MNNRHVCFAMTSLIMVLAAAAHADSKLLSLSGSPDAQVFVNPPDFFPILPWDPLHGWYPANLNHRHGLKSMVECEFTMGGFVRNEDLRQAEKLGLKVLVFPDAPDPRAWKREWKSLSDQEIDERVRTLVKQGGRSKAILGYFLTDEPGASSFAALAKAVAAVKKYAPGKLAYINLFPGYATIGAENLSQLETPSFTEYLERYVKEVKPQLISYDNYMVQYSMDMVDKKAAWRYYADLLEVRRVAQAHGLPFWNIVSSNQIRPSTTIPSPANLAFQAYTTLAAGGRGVTWYTYYARKYGYAPVDDSENRTVTWQYLRTVNHQLKTLGPLMNHLESTGVYFTAPSPVDGLPQLPGRLVESIDSGAPMMLGEFKASDGAAYCMVVNLSLEKSARFLLKVGGKPVEGLIVSPEDGQLTPYDSEKGAWVTAGHGALIKMAKTP